MLPQSEDSLLLPCVKKGAEAAPESWPRTFCGKVPTPACAQWAAHSLRRAARPASRFALTAQAAEFTGAPAEPVAPRSGRAEAECLPLLWTQSQASSWRLTGSLGIAHVGWRGGALWRSGLAALFPCGEATAEQASACSFVSHGV